MPPGDLTALPDDTARPPQAAARRQPDEAHPGWLSPGWLTLAAALLLILWILPGLAVAPATKERIAYVLAFLLGGAVGLTELLARYRDNPVAVMITKPAAVYVAVNACASILAFWLIYTGRLPLEAKLFAEKHKALNALFLAVFGAMAFFRTSVFNLRVRDTTISIGPAAVLQILLRLADREVDRLRASARAGLVRRIMAGVTYDRAKVTLPFFATNVMQNLSPEERNDLDQALAQLAAADLSDEAKAYNLGLLLMNVLGEDALERAVQGLGERIRGPAPEEERSPIFTQATNLDFDDLRSILSACEALDREQRNGDATARLRPMLADRGHVARHGRGAGSGPGGDRARHAALRLRCGDRRPGHRRHHRRALQAARRGVRCPGKPGLPGGRGARLRRPAGDPRGRRNSRDDTR